jgi:hypothetical protein
MSEAIREAIERTSAAMLADPAKAQQSELPPPLASSKACNAKAPSPGWLMRGALAACTEVSVDSESDHRGMLGLDGNVSAAMRTTRLRVPCTLEVEVA